jgi:hypothetical protein
MTQKLAHPKPVGPRGTMNRERAAKIAARRLGITVEEYTERRGSGQKWCYACRVWHPYSNFNRNKCASDGLANVCRKVNADRCARAASVPPTVLSLDFPRTEFGGVDLHSVIADPSTVLDYGAIEAAETLRMIVGDMEPEDVRLLDAASLARLQDKLRDAGLVPRGVQDSERERLRPENRHAGGSIPKIGRKHGGRRTRSEQSQVMRDHNVRVLDDASKKAHRQFRKVRKA